MTMISNLVRCSTGQLHTIISTEIIKPSSPTPSHLKTYNLSMLDQIMLNTFVPIVTFYPNTNTRIHNTSRDKTFHLKRSLSQTLTKYYPFAGTLAKVAPTYVDCNDYGVEFIEAYINTTLDDFLQNSNHQDLDQFFPHGLVNYKSNYPLDDPKHLHGIKKIPVLAVQVNYFKCGGVAVAVSMSHKVVDAASLIHFISDWAEMTRSCFRGQQKNYEFSSDPQFIHFQCMNMNSMEYVYERSEDCVTESFIFPNSKINELKLKLKTITNPTRVDVLTWLLYKCSVAASTKNNPGSCYKPTGVAQLVNLRSKMKEKLPEKSIGNFITHMEILTKNGSEINPESFISEVKRQKIQIKSLRNIETVFGIISNTDLEEQKRRAVNLHVFSSLCGFHAYDIDFGWGRPIKTTLAGDMGKNSFVLMDAPNMDGIEAIVCLEKHDMEIFKSDSQLLAFT